MKGTGQGIKAVIPILAVILSLFSAFPCHALLYQTGRIVILNTRRSGAHLKTEVALRKYLTKDQSKSSCPGDKHDQDTKIRPRQRIYLHGKRIRCLRTYYLCDWSGSRGELYESIAEDNPELLIAIGTPAAIAARDFPGNVPMLFALVLDPSFRHLKNNNSTGVTLKIPLCKRLETFHAIANGKKTGLILLDDERLPANTIAKADALKISLQVQRIHAPGGLSTALERLLEAGIDGFMITADPRIYNSPRIVRHILLWGLRNRIAIMGLSAGYVRNGALAALEPNYTEIGRQVAIMAAGLLLRGELPTNLPVTSPRNNRLFINLNTARRLGITISERILKDATVIVN